MLVLFIYITRLASNEIFSPSNKIHREVGQAKALLALLYSRCITRLSVTTDRHVTSSVISAARPSSLHKENRMSSLLSDRLTRKTVTRVETNMDCSGVFSVGDTSHMHMSGVSKH